MTNKLKQYFPIIRTRKELLEKIHGNPELKSIFDAWKKEQQNEFLDFCTGVKGIKILYDSFFKEVMNPEYAKERLEGFLEVLLRRKVTIVKVLPNDSTRIADETSLLVTDIIVELDDGALANVEIQKIGYAFSAERSSCYSSDMLLRQYKRMRSKYNESFSYAQIKNVYLIVIYEKSPKEFKVLPQNYCHYGKQIFNTGLQLNMLQEYVMISLDIFRKNMENKSIETPLEAWLTFLSSEEPERIIELITAYPQFKPMYETLYQMCQEVERAMGFFSEELRIMDRNLVKYMIEEQQEELEENKRQMECQKREIEGQQREIEGQQREIESQQREIEGQQREIESQQREIESQQREIEALKRELELLKNRKNE